MEFLEVKELCKVYGRGESQVVALDHVSLSIEKGEFTAIIGSSGSGKSTLLHAIAGVDQPNSGAIYLNGENIYSGSNEKLAIFRRRQVVVGVADALKGVEQGHIRPPFPHRDALIFPPESVPEPPRP